MPQRDGLGRSDPAHVHEDTLGGIDAHARSSSRLADLHKELEAHYSDIGRPSVDPELMIRMPIVGYCYGIRSERRSPRKSSCTSPIAGSAGSIWKTRSRTTRRSGLCRSRRRENAFAGGAE